MNFNLNYPKKKIQDIIKKAIELKSPLEIYKENQKQKTYILTGKVVGINTILGGQSYISYNIKTSHIDFSGITYKEPLEINDCVDITSTGQIIKKYNKNDFLVSDLEAEINNPDEKFNSYYKFKEENTNVEWSKMP